MRINEARLTRLAASYPRMSPRRRSFPERPPASVSATRAGTSWIAGWPMALEFPSSNSRLEPATPFSSAAKRGSKLPARPGHVTPSSFPQDPGSREATRFTSGTPDPATITPRVSRRTCRAWAMTCGGRSEKSVSERNRQSVAKGLVVIEPPLLRVLTLRSIFWYAVTIY